MKIGIVIPWRKQPSRAEAFNAVMKWYKENLPDASLYLCDRPGDVWSMSGSRNDGVRAAEADGCDVIVMNDADTIPQLDSLKNAIAGALQDNMVHLPYKEYRQLTPAGTNLYLSGKRNELNCPRKIIHGACSGVNVFTPQCWWSLGGNDEKFKGWGWEDTAMEYAHDIIKGRKYVRHNGIVFALNHEEQPRDLNTSKNKVLYEKYIKIRSADRLLDFISSNTDSLPNSEFCLFILGNGRKGYLERTVESWEANLIDTPKYKFIFDDSGNPDYVNWLIKRFPQYEVVPVGDSPMGQPYAIDLIFNKIKHLDVDYILQIEEDWVLNRPLSVIDIMSAMNLHKNILQMRIPRTIWYSSYHVLDINAGSLLQYHLNISGSKNWNNRDEKNSWYEWRGDFYFWSHNPNIFSKSICEENYLVSDDHELDFGKRLLKNYPNGTVGFWAENPYDAYITHIGIRDDELLKQLPPHPKR